MPEVVNTSFLECTLNAEADSRRETMVGVDHVTMIFNMASQQLNSLKEYAIALARRELRFKEFRALDDVSLEVKRGDVFGIMGTNGSGKSTLLKIIAGVLEPTHGSCRVKGSIAPLIELGAGFDFELTARENIYLNGALLGYDRAYIDAHFDEIVDFAEVGQFLDMPMKNYSSGMVARVAFAVATVVVPDVLIVDEVLSVGDFMFQQKCERKIESLIKDHEVTVLIVSHSTGQVERLCNKAAWIEKGHLRAIGDAEEVCGLYRILGGHEGSAEAEALVYEAMKLPEAPEAVEAVKTIAGDDRYGSAVNLYEASWAGAQHEAFDTIVIAPGEQGSFAMVGNALAGTLGAPLFLVRAHTLPDITAHALRQVKAKRVLMVGGREHIGASVETELAALFPEARLERISGATAHDVALSAWRALPEAWGDTALLTWDGCTGDTISLLPYTLPSHTPFFYLAERGVIDEEVRAALAAGGFKNLIALGGQGALPDAEVASLPAELHITRLCGTSPTDANNLINAWITEQTGDAYDEVCVVSGADEADALALGPYLAGRQTRVLFENAGDLNSIANAIRMVQAKSGPLKLTFIGNDARFRAADKALLAKAQAAGAQN